MEDDLTKTSKADGDRINVNQEFEVNYWANEFGVTRDQLRGVIAKFGPMVKNVRDHLYLRN